MPDQAPGQEDVRGNAGMLHALTSALDGDKWSASRPGQTKMVHKFGLDTVGKAKSLAPAQNVTEF
jgi:hypothetical protein